jgi:periplasmic protein TonB
VSRQSWTYTTSFFVAAALHAGVFFAAGNVLQTDPSADVPHGSSIEVTLMEAVHSEETPAVEPAPSPFPESPPPEPPEPSPQIASESPEATPAKILESINTTPQAPQPQSQPSPSKAAVKSRSTVKKPALTRTAAGFAGVQTFARPNYLRNPPPLYPTESKTAGEEGVVLLIVQVTQDGRVSSVAVRRSSGFPRLDRAAITAVQRWHFTPARMAGVPVQSKVEVPVRFNLN